MLLPDMLGASAASPSGAATFSPLLPLLALPVDWLPHGGIDSLPVLAGLCTTVNLWRFFGQRKGFGDTKDVLMSDYFRNFTTVTVGASLALSLGLVWGPAASPASGLWLGMSLAGLMKNAVTSTGLGRYLLGIVEKPPEHGTYGKIDTSINSKYNVEIRKMREDPQAAARWDVAKTLINLDCDTRILSMVEKIGLMDRSQSDLETAQELLAKRRAELERLSEKQKASDNVPGATTVGQ
jgi:hypothetical protein